MIKKVFFLKPKRTWHDYNVFERKMWAQLFTEKKSELRRRFGHSIECYRIAKRYADNEMRRLGQVKDISDANKNTDVVVEFSARRKEKVG